MKTLLAGAAAMALWLGALPALAQQPPPQQRQDEIAPPPPAPSGRPVTPPQGQLAAPARPSSWRMTPEERRQLRHDINQHGREVYRERRLEGRH